MYNALGSAATAKQAAGSSEEIGESRCPNHRNCANGRIKVKRVWGKLRMCCVELEVLENASACCGSARNCMPLLCRSRARIGKA